MKDTTRIYYIDVWFLTQNLPYYQPETLTSFTFLETRLCAGDRSQSCQGTLHHEGTIPAGTLRFKVP